MVHALRVLILVTLLAIFPLGSAGQTVYLPEVTDSFITSRTIDQDKAVGETAGVADVTPIGGASYTIPLYVPPGTNGMQPSLSLAYNSHGGDGMLGWGWGLSGLSAISRTGCDWYHDGFTKGVSYTASDRFMADGLRLVMLTGTTYGAPGTTYDTENAAFSVFTANGSLGSGPASFTAITKDGMLMEYGATTDSRVMGNNGTAVVTWRLNKVVDPHGNYITYTYALSEGENILAQVDYTGNANAGITPFNKIVFTYGSRPDKNEVLLPGSGHKTTNLIQAITVYCEGLDIKTYLLNYSLRDIDKSYLREITEYGADSTGMNSTLFKYGDQAAPWFISENSYAMVGEAHDFFTGDYDGDGRTEILSSAYFHTNEGFRYNTDLKIHRWLSPDME